MKPVSRRPTCLWVTREYPYPANRGAFLYSAGLIAALAEAGAEITVLCPTSQALATEPLQTDERGVKWMLIHSTARARAPSLASRLPSDAFRLATRALRRALRAECAANAFDVWIIDHAAMGWSLDAVRRHSDTPSPAIVYVSHNFETRVRAEVAEGFVGSAFMRQVLRYEAWKYARLEARICSAAALITCITDHDRQSYAQRWPGKQTLVLPPGYHRPAGGLMALGQGTPRRVLLLGSFDWLAKRINLEELLRCAEDLFTRRKIELQVVGRADADYVRRIQRAHPFCDFQANVDDVAPFIRNARIGLIPEAVGGGFKLKALDYIFHGLPVAALEGAAAGLPLGQGSVMLENDLPRLLEVVAARIDSLDALRRQRQAAYVDCADAFDWPQRGLVLIEQIKHIMA